MKILQTYTGLVISAAVFCLLLSMIFLQKQKKCWIQAFPVKMPNQTETQISELQMKANEIFKQIDQTISRTYNIIKEKSSSATISRVTLRNPKSSYCVGDHLAVQVEMFDYQGNKKTYGGDYLRARMFTAELGAAASGRIEDFHNGTYNVYFILFWEGKVNISVFLMHPSEGASALWTYRNKWHGYVDHLGQFTNPHGVESVKCGFELINEQAMCEFKDQRDEEFFYCIKPQNSSCESLTHVKSWWREDRTLLNHVEKSLFNKSNVRVEIPNDFDVINVLLCNNKSAAVKEKCGIGKKLEYPSGYVMREVWHPKICYTLTYDSLEEMDECLQGKFIYLLGDSTLRQWILYFQKHVKNLKQFNLYEDNWARQLLSVDLTRNMKITWKRHTYPFVSGSYQSWNEERTIAREIDLIRGDQHTVIVLNIGIHFRAYPIYHFIQRLLNTRRAIERLFLRSPQTKVIIKTENTSAMKSNFETMSDFHASVHYLIMEIIFNDLKVGFVNGWDMTNAFDSNDIHPPEMVIKNEVKMLMTYIC